MLGRKSRSAAEILHSRADSPGRLKAVTKWQGHFVSGRNLSNILNSNTKLVVQVVRRGVAGSFSRSQVHGEQ